MKTFDTKRFEVDFKDRNVPYMIENRVKGLGDKVFFMFQNERVTYKELNEKVNRIANSLAGMGVEKGDKVCFMMKNSIEFVYCWFALAKLGAIMVPMNPTLRGNLLQYIINNSDTTIAIVDNDLQDRIQFIEENIPKINQIVVVKENPEFKEVIKFKRIKLMEFESLMESSAPAPNVRVDPWDTMSIIYTSGTTGPSKGAVISHHYYYDNAFAAIEWMRHSEEDVIYSCLPFSMRTLR